MPSRPRTFEIARLVVLKAPFRATEAEKYMRAHLREKITVKDIANAVGVSERTLFADLRYVYAATPTKMLLTMRLEGAHKRLQTSSSNDLLAVADVAREYCFSNAGRFARAYRKEFGEMPSTTLMRGRRI
jgi:transcriptional regulator GlxA family with amidase domain